jgi:hypothetical protein
MHLWALIQPLFIVALVVVFVFNALIPLIRGTQWWPWFRRSTKKKIWETPGSAVECLEKSDELLDGAMAYADEAAVASREQGEHAKEILEQASQSGKAAQKRVDKFEKMND